MIISALRRVRRTGWFYLSHPVTRVQEVATAVGERYDIAWLTYNPLVFRYYHRMALNLAPGVMRAIANTFPAVGSLVDVGAGSGAYAAEARRHGWRIVACEHARAGRAMARRQGVEARPFDLALDPPSDVKADFDLAYSFEVAEHLPPQLGDALVRYLSGLAPMVVFTAAPPGQGGIGHINEQPQEYWISRFEREGMRHDRDATDSLRREFTTQGVGVPLLGNLMIFQKASEVPETASQNL